MLASLKLTNKSYLKMDGWKLEDEAVSFWDGANLQKNHQRFPDSVADSVVVDS